MNVCNMRKCLQVWEKCLQISYLAGIADSSIPGFLQDCIRLLPTRPTFSVKERIHSVRQRFQRFLLAFLHILLRKHAKLGERAVMELYSPLNWHTL